jgi:hypothetical protein
MTCTVLETAPRKADSPSRERQRLEPFARAHRPSLLRARLAQKLAVRESRPTIWGWWIALLLLGGYLLFCHGCHADEDTELRAARLLVHGRGTSMGIGGEYRCSGS